MEDVIEIYGRPLDEQNPVVCFDESPFQLLKEVREPMPARPGRPRREDSEYERCGVAEVMKICQPAAGLRKCMVMEHRKKTDFATDCKEFDRIFPDAHWIALVCDNPICAHRNAQAKPVQWQFNLTKARVRMAWVYPDLPPNEST